MSKAAFYGTQQRSESKNERRRFQMSGRSNVLAFIIRFLNVVGVGILEGATSEKIKHKAQRKE